MTSTIAAATLWVCTDCLFAREGDPSDEPTDREPWSALAPAADVTLGLLWAEHFDPIACEDAFRSGGDACGCETDDFSWSSCHGCGSTLGGSRHAYTLWVTP